MGGTFGPSAPQPIPTAVNEIESLVRSMGGTRAAVIRYRYIARMTIRDIAAECDCNKSRTETELASALSWLEGALSSQASFE